MGKRKAKETFQQSKVEADISLSSEDGEERRDLEILSGKEAGLSVKWTMRERQENRMASRFLS